MKLSTLTEHASRARGFALLALMLLGGCSSQIQDAPNPLKNASTASGAPLPSAVGATGCNPGSPAHSLGGAIEIEGEANSGTQVWALVHHRTPIPSNQDVEILWSMNGGTKLRVTAVAADGSRLAPESLFLSAGGSWDRPGSTWATTFNFPTPGCWRLAAERGDRHGDVWLKIA